MSAFLVHDLLGILEPGGSRTMPAVRDDVAAAIVPREALSAGLAAGEEESLHSLKGVDRNFEMPEVKFRMFVPGPS